MPGRPEIAHGSFRPPDYAYRAEDPDAKARGIVSWVALCWWERC